MILAAVSLLLAAGTVAAPAHEPSLRPAERAAIRLISARSMRGRLSFLSSNLLEGRETPSRGLDIAAEYIASEFRRDGLEPGGDDGYFQTSKMIESRANLQGFRLTLLDGSRSLQLGPETTSLSIFHATEFHDVPVYKFDLANKDLLGKTQPRDLDGKVVLMQGPSRELLGSLRRAARTLMRSRPSALVMIGGDGLGIPEGVRLRQAGDEQEPGGLSSLPIVHISDPRLVTFFGSLPPGESHASASMSVSAPLNEPVTVRNVIGILRGSDPKLKDTCVLVTAHYDHLGIKPAGSGDRIYNGANDDGSGTVSVMEIAGALAASRFHPRRSIVFMTFYGEEEGDLGSHYYAEHPVFPLNKTVADINLEQVGRTDSTEGPQIANASVTGFGYSTVTDVLALAGRLTGIKIYKDPKNSDAYFALSDNQALADAGVPAHTLCVAFDFPDYHGVGDEWPKIDYDNMAKVDRAVTVALLRIANSRLEPHWKASEPHAARYLQIRKESLGTR